MRYIVDRLVKKFSGTELTQAIFPGGPQLRKLFKKQGRNSKCLCGSGKKYKKYCINTHSEYTEVK